MPPVRLPSQGTLSIIVITLSLVLVVQLLGSYRGSSGTALQLYRHHALSYTDRAAVHAACSRLGGLPGHDAAATRRRYLVTGAAGFIGFHACVALAERGDVVVGLDNFNDYYPVSLKDARARELAAMGVHVVAADINDAATLADVFAACDGGFTHVVHFAAQAGVRYAARNPHSYVASNVAGAVSLLEAVKAQSPVPVVVYASSSSIYGLTKLFPFSESDRADVPSSLYAATKRSQELLMHTYHHLYGISTTGLRFFTVYGPWGRPDMSMMSFSRSILEGRPIKVFQGPGGSELARDFTFVGDIVEGVLGAIDTAPPSVKGQAKYRIYNLGNTHPATLTTFVRTLEAALGHKAEITYKPVPGLGDVLKTHANISAAQLAFGYAPHTQLDVGLRKFAQWYLEYYGADGSRRAADDVSYKPD